MYCCLLPLKQDMNLHFEEMWFSVFERCRLQNLLFGYILRGHQVVQNH